jgi:type II secretory pathway component PulF
LRFFIRQQTGKVWFDTLLLRIPLLGGCLQSLALSRLALAMTLTLDSGMPIAKAIRLSLKASGNAFYEEQGDFVERELHQGETLVTAISSAGILPDDFRHILSTAEQSGRIPEAMRHQYKRYQEEGERQMKALAQLAVWIVWVVYAAFMVIMVLRIASIYFSALPK